MNTTSVMAEPLVHFGAGAVQSGAPQPLLDSIWQENAWQQVLARDQTADGRFVYGVRSTGIFCRPSCPSRRPARSRVVFFGSPAEAGDSGFRACLRCRPNETGSVERLRDRAVVDAVMRQVERRDGGSVTLAALSVATGATRSAILRAFRRALGTTPARFLRERRMGSFRTAISTADREDARTARITDRIYDAGFGSSSRLYEASGAALGMTPSALRAGAPGERIHITVADSPLGRTLVAATARGICAISFADTDEALRAELRGRFPKAEFVEVVLAGAGVSDGSGPEAGAMSDERTREGLGASDPVAAWLSSAVRFVLAELSESPAAAAFPLDVRATAFQQRVWHALQAIPRGERRSYAEVARQIGQPTGARAVASACARNPVALAIPCHRVVGGTGAMAGYRWGVERKRQLLQAERGPAVDNG